MEQWEVLAVDKRAVLRFKADNREVPGIRLLLRGAAPAGSEADRYLGFDWHDQFISNERLRKLDVTPVPGDLIEMYFNRYGDIEKIIIV